ncbi:S10 family peptidase [Sphingomonas flavalba]|uniref:S10 family peptidase n=1 Tax=Sphingomonas flavalba TaxID=2559804 RepID=UPI00109DDC19|nr:peptidase S10 [Sphingomonas flavalba]
MAKRLRGLWAALALGVLAPGVAIAAGPAPAAPEAATDQIETARPSRGKVTVAGRTIPYTVTPGTLIIRDDAGAPIASMFYVGYVADRPAGTPERPITFLFNGGPGSASMFLHLGSIAPVRIAFPAGTTIAPAPYRLAENPYSMIDRTDMVFIDLIGGGLSRAAGKAKEADFWSVDADVDSFARAIRRYLTINKRWNSPKYLFGESYGTTRAAGLAYKLGTAEGGGIKLNGVILLGVNLNHGIYQSGFDEAYINWMPSYAATAWYHDRLASRPAALEPFLTEVREWARGPYARVLAKGYEATAEERQAIARQYSAYTGLPESLILDANLRPEQGTFRKQLLRDRGQTVGRLDSRAIGRDADNQGAVPEYDATASFNTGPFVTVLNDYLFGTLGYPAELEYRPHNYGNIRGRWDRGHTGPAGNRMALANVAIDLAQAMRENRSMKLLTMNGYYDLATPFFKAEYDVKHMPIDAGLQKNVTFSYFEAGHMIYTNPAAMAEFKAVLDRFYDENPGTPTP